MLEIFLLLLPLFSLIAVGYVVGITKVGTPDWVKILNLFGYYVAFPALILQSLANSEISVALHGPIMMVQLAMAVSLMLLTYWLCTWLNVSNETRNTFTVGIYFSNAAYLGLPAIERVFGGFMTGEAAVVVVVMIITTLTLGLGLVERSNSGKMPLKQLFLQSLRNPLIWSAIVGGAISISNISLPAVFKQSISLLAGAASPTVLVALGIFLALNHPSRATLKQASILAALKMLVLPGIFTLIMLFASNDDWLDVTYIQFSMPIAVTMFAFAEIYPMNKQVVSTALVMSTLLSVLIVPLVMWLSTII